jgi:hypothetical protein
MPDDVWVCIQQHAGMEFLTMQGYTFTYENIGPNTVRVIRPKFTRTVGRAVFEQAYDRWPVAGPGELRDLQAPAFLWAILNDHRIIHG